VSNISKNGQRNGKQNYICKECGRQFIDCYEPPRGYSLQVKQQCLSRYVNGMGFRSILFQRGYANERVMGVNNNTTVMDWVRQGGENLPDYYHPNQLPQVGELDELCLAQSVSF
jgi:transposase-like protein